MSNGLSQAEIDALLRGDESAPSEDASAEAPAPEQEPQAAPKKASAPTKAQAAETAPPAAQPEPPAAVSPPQDTPAAENLPEEEDEPDYSHLLTPRQTDAMGELGNISMGTAATTLSTMLNRRVDITTPHVTVQTMRQIARQYPLPFVAVQVQYTKGIEGTNVLFLKVSDVKIITDLLMGGDGSNTEKDLTEMHLSAISEVMNQMVGSSSTSLAKLIGKPIDISPPVSYSVNLANDITQAPFDHVVGPIVRTSFSMEVEGLIQSEIMQVMPVEFAGQLVEGLLSGGAVAAVEQRQTNDEEVKRAAIAARDTGAKASAKEKAAPPAKKAAPPPPPQQQARQSDPASMVDVHPAPMETFEREDVTQSGEENMELLMDVPLSVSVELGKSRKYIKEILDFNMGSIIVLDKMAGEMVDVVVNGKLIAKAEVVVIDDNYGARITDIVTPAKRLGASG
ncbi:MAG: flagellar motor switch phosphatase FliY [Oscillospiraceae bacterium]|jgi:flagellar motor switch protein FliN/FliY|nr:flagellar motor switch phosphatase FliY [Oscillospiraceae bacterium]